MAVTLRDVATLAGVSFKTVSNVINHHPHVRPATRQKVEAAISELGYVANPTARSLRTGRSGMISLAVPELRVSYYAELADRVVAAAAERGMTVLIEQTGPSGEREAAVLSSPQRQITDGLILATVAEDPNLRPPIDVNYPLLALGDWNIIAGYDHIGQDNVVGARMAVEHLIAKGCRHIAVLGEQAGDRNGTPSQRLEGYRQALAAAGIEYRPELLGRTGIWHRRSGAEAMQRLLDSGLRIDGVFGMNDDLALGGLHVLHAAGLRVPEDVAVIGFDNIDDAIYSSPSLSSIDPQTYEIAPVAVRLLLARIEDPLGPAVHLTSSSVLVERDSTRR
ncbi:MAG: LacI family transcriptional regulator [Promicromonosporaceae bacterium]|nr:LacI family transcriptional regulator [Promicromonosporaceae bacterium]